MKRAIQNMLEDRIAEGILDGRIKPNITSKIEVHKEGDIVIK